MAMMHNLTVDVKDVDGMPQDASGLACIGTFAKQAQQAVVASKVQ